MSAALTVADALRSAYEHGWDVILALPDHLLLGEEGEILGRGYDFLNVRFTFAQVCDMVDRLDAEAAH